MLESNKVDERKYVVINLHYRAIMGELLLFLGTHTEDNQKRSFGGCTVNINECERYTREELEWYRKNCKERYPFFDEIDINDFYKKDKLCISIDELKSLGYREVTAMVR